LPLWSRLELGVDDRVEAAALPVAEGDLPVLAHPPENLERCFVGRLHFLREQLLTAVGEIEPEGYEHARQSKPIERARKLRRLVDPAYPGAAETHSGGKLHKTWTGF
jgi:hypothetical protein